MRKVLYTIAVLFISFCSFSQNATLTKGETVEYLNKKIKEVAGMQSYIRGKNYPDNSRFFNINMLDNRLEIFHTYPDYNSASYKFNPRFIEKIEFAGFYSQDSITSIINVTLKDPMASYVGNGQYVTKYVSFPFMYSDRSNFDKIKKALLHLKALLDAEDDPFK